MGLRGGGARALGVSIAGALAAAGLALVYAAVVPTGQALPSGSKASPFSLTVFSSSGLPPEVQAQEAASAPLLFDRDTDTQHAAFAESQVQASFEGVHEVRAIKVFGAAPYVLTVKADAGGSFQAIAGLENLNLTQLSNAWHTFQASAGVSTTKLLFALSPATGGTASGLREIEVWTAAAPVSAKDGAALLERLLGPTPPQHARLYTALNPTANPTVGVVTHNDSGGGLADNKFTFSVDRDPAQFVRAYLTYELFGQASFVSPLRKINGLNSNAGGGLLLPAASWSTQAERINPAWLKRGANTIEFSVLSSSNQEAGYTVRNVRVVAELDNGANAIEAISANQPDASNTNPVAAMHDGDLESGWRPYPADQPISANVPALELDLRRPTQLDGVSLYMSAPFPGQVQLSIKQAGQWLDFPAEAPGALDTGWNTIQLPASVALDQRLLEGARLTFLGGLGSSAEVRELLVVGSAVGGRTAPPRIFTTFPDQGQFYGRRAFVQGFVEPWNNGSGLASIKVGGVTVFHNAGSMSEWVTKEQVGLGAQADSDAWSAEIKVVYPNGETVSSIVQFGQQMSAASPLTGPLAGTLNSAVGPKTKKTISHDESKLVVDAGTVSADTTITITPLAEESVPALDVGMVNVTKGPRRGYRFLPHGAKFLKNVNVTLPYDRALIPPGHTEDDVRTYFFDEQAGRWVALPFVSVDKTNKLLNSTTNHFTDMINAVVTVPDHPQAVSFNPTSMKDIKAADPGAQINLIEPPKANNQGDARLSYPIEVPPGRQGLQPQLAVQYSSSGGNGWMGIGWDIPMQAVTIDTRFGVPRYDAGLETETYMLSGEMLTPVAHRGELVARTAEKVFRTRVEGQFRRIIRRGNLPSNYSWEVTDKNGVKYLYGATDPATETLTDEFGNRFLWALCEIRDPSGNFVKFRYAKVSDPGVGSVPGSNIYLQRITYTGHGTTEGLYSVTFVRDRDPSLNEPRRADVQIDARGGFKRVTADLLRKVEVSFGTTPVRSYEFRYNENPFGDNRPALAFNKTLLTSVSQFGSDGALFNKHTLTYYDEARDTAGGYRGFASTSDWSIGNDGVGIGLMGRGTASAIGGNQSVSAGGHLYVGVGACCDVSSKEQTGGFKVGFSRSQSESLIAMADVDGDGLPDKVFKGNGFFYRKNLSGPNGMPRFDDPFPLEGLTAISRERVSSTTVGGEIYFGLPVMLDFNRATTTADTYFTDVNGDGLTDLVNGGQVVFGFLNAAGKPVFGANSADTPVPVGGGAIITDNLLENAAAIEAENATNFPLLDTLRRWVAPYDGTVSINAPVRLIEDTSPERAQSTAADGVRVAIQLEGTELWSATIAKDDYATKTPTGVSAVPVLKGQRLYFRVQSVFQGEFDQVAWDPEISYSGVDAARTDVNSLPEYRYSASADFTLAGRSASVTLPVTGTLRLGGTFEKSGVTTDDVKLVITRNGMEVFSQNVGFADSATVTLAQDLSVTKLDVLEWRIMVDSPIDAGRVRFTPAAHYTAAEGVDTVVDEQGNFLLKVDPPYDMDLYPANALAAPQAFFTVPVPATTPLPVQAHVRFDGLNAGEVKQAIFTVKRRGVLLLKRPITVTGTGAPSDAVRVQADVNVSDGEQLFFDVSSRDPLFGAKLGLLEARVGQDSDADGLLDTLVPSALHTRALDGLFAQPYRGWGAAGYHGNSPRDATPINQTLLVLNEHTTADNTRAYLYFPRPALGLWGGIDELAWVKAGSASASRLGLDDIRVARSEQFAGASAPARISRSENTSISAGITASTGFSESKLDFQDLNGDRFPDIVSASGGVQYSRAVGGLEAGRRGGGAGPARRSENFTAGASTDGAGNIARAIAAARGQVAGDGTKSGQGASQGMDMPSLGFSANIGTGTADTEHDLIDINGDGLPDKVFRGGDVELNLGYRFSGVREPWGGGIVNDGRSLDAGGGVNLGFNRAFYSMAGGLSLTIGMTKSDETYADINGDGLPDKIRLGSPFSVRLNTGTGFVPVSWPGGHDQVSMDKHISLGGGGYVTFGISIPLVGIKIVFNPGVNLSTNLGRPEVAFRDMDGDGFADHIFSERDSQLRVALNPIGRTNLLKQVVRPMGATIDLEYIRDGNTFDLPQSRWVMSRTVVFDGHPGEGADTQVTTFRYSAPKYNRLERDFYGYTTVAEEQRDTQNFGSVYRTVTRDYLSDSYYTKGLVRKEVLQDSAGRPFTETENTYIVRDEGTGQPLATLASTTATGFPQLSRTDRRFYEGLTSPGKTTFTTQTYDAFGNVDTFTDAGEPLVATDDVLATIEYTNCQPAYIIKPRRIEVRGNSVPMRLREADINCTSGDVERVRQYLADMSTAVTDLTYFANGNLQTVRGPANKRGQRYQLSYEYDAQVATHVTRITDSFGLSSQASYNLLFGKVETTTDTNANQTTNLYDTVGRSTHIFGPYEQAQGTATLSFDYRPDAAVPHAITRHVDKDADGNSKSSGTIDTILFTDGLKRVIQTKKDATVLEGNANAAQDRMIVSGQVTFDAFGRTVAQRYPTTEHKASDVANGMFNSVADAEPPTTMTFDVLDRNTRTTNPDGTFTTMAYGFGADRAGTQQFETVLTDANVNAGVRGAVKRTYRDVRELITAVRDLNNAGAEVIWTSYTYDALKQMTQVSDDKLNTTNVGYDNFGRRTVIDNPDTGRTETQYDLASNVTKKITANLKAQARSIDYDYDFKRLVSITYPNFPVNNVTYTYGTAGAGFNTAGRITRVTSQMGVEERQYGKLGETVYEKKTVTTFTNPSHPSVFETRYHFESFGRLLRITYPDLEVVTNVYDSGGNLKSASGVKRVDNEGQNHRYNYLQNLLYDKFEQRAFLEQGNGVKTAYSYNAQTRRLANLSAIRQGNNLFQNLHYSYDKVGNVLGLQNVVDVPPPNVFGGPTNQTFVYDDLYRLTHAEGTFQYSPQKTHTYRLDLTYDSIHNILRKNQLHQIVQPSSTAITQKKTSYDFNYAYAPSGPASVRPHAPTHVGVRTYAYDANGNQTGWTHDQNGTRRSIVWDDENRIQSLFDNGHEKTYKYDDQGQRVIKRGPQGETVYVNQFYTQRPGATGTKHVYAGTSRIASKLLRQDGPNANPHGKTPFEKDIYFYHPDHVGSSNYITDLNGKLYEHLEYFPFGEGWVEENSNVQRTPYLFTAKELDEETGLYYFGARYYDPRVSVWQSADPILGKYLVSDINDAANNGAFNSLNLGLYSYGYLNPVTFKDPDGELALQAAGAVVGAVVGLGFQAATDVYHGKLSSFSEYAGAAVGGAAGGAAATVCGPACAGAAAAAASNLTQQGINALTGDDKGVTMADRAKSLVVDTAVGAVGGQVAGKVLPTVFKAAVPESVKGKIGEGLTELGLRATGQKIAEKQVANQVGRSTFDFRTAAGKFVESKFGTSKLSGPQREAARRLQQSGNPLERHDWTYPRVSGMAASGPAAGAASAPEGEK